MSVPSEWSKTEARNDADPWAAHGSDFVLISQARPPSRIELARERILVSRLYLGLLRTITDDYGTAFAAQSDSLTLRTIGIYVFLRTDRKSTRLNSSHMSISYAVFCLKKKKKKNNTIKTKQ